MDTAKLDLYPLEEYVHHNYDARQNAKCSETPKSHREFYWQSEMKDVLNTRLAA